ncbi:MAG: hypothetical protein RLY61_887 [Candidatus Parcubacteria bacterium]
MQTAHRNGFTLVEIIIVVSIISLLTAGLIPSFSNYTKSQTLKQAQEQIVSDLANVQNRALAGEQGEGVTGTKYWGLRFVDGSATYQYFAHTSATCPSGGVNIQRSETLKGEVEVDVTGSACVFFSTANGDATGLSSVSVKESGSATCKKININSAGLISKATCP